MAFGNDPFAISSGGGAGNTPIASYTVTDADTDRQVDLSGFFEANKKYYAVVKNSVIGNSAGAFGTATYRFEWLNSGSPVTTTYTHVCYRFRTQTSGSAMNVTTQTAQATAALIETSAFAFADNILINLDRPVKSGDLASAVTTDYLNIDTDGNVVSNGTFDGRRAMAIRCDTANLVVDGVRFTTSAANRYFGVGTTFELYEGHPWE